MWRLALLVSVLLFAGCGESASGPPHKLTGSGPLPGQILFASKAIDNGKGSTRLVGKLKTVFSQTEPFAFLAHFSHDPNGGSLGLEVIERGKISAGGTWPLKNPHARYAVSNMANTQKFMYGSSLNAGFYTMHFYRQGVLLAQGAFRVRGTIHNLPPGHLTAAQRSKATTLLNQSVTRYASLLDQGRAVLGTTQYPGRVAGLNAITNDPTSAASRFSAWQQTAKPYIYQAAYMNTVNQLGHTASGSSGPGTLTTWEDDMSTVGTDFLTWVQDARSWQIGGVLTAQLDRDEQNMRQDLSLARTVIPAVVSSLSNY